MISCSVIAFIPELKLFLLTLKRKSNNKLEGPETTHVLLFGREIIKSFKVSMIGDGQIKNTEKITKSYSKLLYLKFSKYKILKSATFHHHQFMELEIMVSKEVEISIIGVFGLLDLLSNLMKEQLVLSTVNLVLKLYLFGRLSFKLLVNKTENMSHQFCYLMKSTAVSLECSKVT